MTGFFIVAHRLTVKSAAIPMLASSPALLHPKQMGIPFMNFLNRNSGDNEHIASATIVEKGEAIRASTQHSSKHLGIAGVI